VQLAQPAFPQEVAALRRCPWIGELRCRPTALDLVVEAWWACQGSTEDEALDASKGRDMDFFKVDERAVLSLPD
jgi:hypothetical protein